MKTIARAIASKDGFGLSDIIVRSLYKESEQEEAVPEQRLADYWLRPMRRI